MLVASDLLHLPYTCDLTQGGIAYALHCLPYRYPRSGGSPYDGLRRLVARAAVELAFRRYLSEQNIPFEVKSAAPFREHDRYDVSLAGRRCEIQSFLIRHHDQVSQIQSNPQILLQVPALVASDQHAQEGYSARDLYLFAFLPARATAPPEELQQRFEPKGPSYPVHLLPEAWNRPLGWNPLGRLVLKSDAEEDITVELGGQDRSRKMKTCIAELPAQKRVEVQNEFHSLSYLHLKSANTPIPQLAIYSPSRKATHLVGPMDWGDLWISGLQVLLVGYITREEFSRRARFLPVGARVFQYDQTHVKNLAVPVSELKPLSELFMPLKASSA
jgi:hypothetical protein